MAVLGCRSLVLVIIIITIMTVKRSRNPTTSPDKSSDKPTDKSVKLDVCKKCNKCL